MQTISLCWQCIIQVLLLLIIANGMPILARNIFVARFNWPLDFGLTFFDQRPLFGYTKTWRGLFFSIVVTTFVAFLLGMSIYDGVHFGVLVMAGDLSGSFIKRRLGYIESSRFRLLDVIPESFLPIFILHQQLGLTVLDGIICIALFFVLEVVLSSLLYRLHIRKRPY
ncbi:MAG: CDP-archaeol synthase [Gammaproteobacteria bacterium]|nr:CDP-archaeol synthase [Gammaproteobacteria bacterium]MDH5591699.1 CDP-archaeol synthase [Gammaproteobacteria bacterium]